MIDQSLHSAFVGGPPATMGSKRAFVAGGRALVVDVNHSGLRSWQDAMRASMRADAPDRPLRGAVAITILVKMLRPRGHYRTGTNAGVLHSWAPTDPTTRPDLDKVARACLDCGRGIWYQDDSQVSDLRVLKRYCGDDDIPGVHAELRRPAAGPAQE